jgi:Ca2+-binding EF-hand superfamily protein
MAKESDKKDAVFRLIDINGDGDVEVSELVDFMNTFGPALTKAEETKLLELVGLKGKSRLSRQDMEVLLTKKVELTNSKEELLQHFKVFDPKNSGTVGLGY